MDPHFRAFSFVDRVTWLQPGTAIRGQYLVPCGLNAFPASLVSEAVGQLASWAAMAAVGFTHRPVAGIAGSIELHTGVCPGQLLDLAAELELVNTETVGYSGTAHADGVLVMRLLDCVGPMLAAEDFDEPEALRDRFARLCGAGASPGSFEGVPCLELQDRVVASAQLVSTLLRVPTDAPFFADHFPRRPVFPGTLLMEANQQTAALLAASVPIGDGRIWVPRVISDVKLRTFISPGETLRLEAKRTGNSHNSLVASVESRIGERLAGSAEIQFLSEAKL